MSKITPENCPGPGDPETWGPVRRGVGDPRDDYQDKLDDAIEHEYEVLTSDLQDCARLIMEEADEDLYQLIADLTIKYNTGDPISIIAYVDDIFWAEAKRRVTND
jgi:hypothetical protein